MSIPGEIGQNIIRLRKGKGITQEEMALNSNMSVSYLRRIETGSANPTIHALQRIANAMQEPLEQLILPCHPKQSPHSPSNTEAEDALSFRMPRSVIVTDPHDAALACPRCKMLLQKEGQAYCDHCGQHLAWDDTIC